MYTRVTSTTCCCIPAPALTAQPHCMSSSTLTRCLARRPSPAHILLRKSLQHCRALHKLETASAERVAPEPHTFGRFLASRRGFWRVRRAAGTSGRGSSRVSSRGRPRQARPGGETQVGYLICTIKEDKDRRCRRHTLACLHSPIDSRARSLSHSHSLTHSLSLSIYIYICMYMYREREILTRWNDWR